MFSSHKPLGIYIHIPFCLSKCAYCDFNSAPPASDTVVTRYIDALIAHIESYKDVCSVYEPDTVFIGGGTPTSIPPDDLFRLIRAIKRNFRLSKKCEFSIECNPATATYSTLSRLHRMGVNRISFGLQSAHENELKALSRCHSRADFAHSFRMARDAKFDNINVDLMFGIPYQTMQSLGHTLRYVTGLGPDHISLYDLKIEPNTPFGKNYSQIAPTLPDEDTEADMYLASVDFLRKHGYRQYEISNFAKSGHACRHNLKYWNCDEYLGLGVSAHSFFNGNRFSFIADTEKYINGITVPGSKIKITEDCEKIEERERMGEYIMLRMRLASGINSSEFMRKFGFSLEELFGDKLSSLEKGGYMRIHDGNYSLTPRGMFVSNYILSDMLDFDDIGNFTFA